MLAMAMPWARGASFGGLGWSGDAEGEEEAAGEGEEAAGDESHLVCSGRQGWIACLPTGLLSPTLMAQALAKGSSSEGL